MTSAAIRRPRSLRRVSIIAALAIALVAAACSGDDDASTPTTTTVATAESDAAPTTGSTTDTFPVTVDHAYGSTVVPAAPQRVVTVGYNDQDPVLALGVVPVGVMPWYEDRPIGFEWTIEAYGGAEPEQVGGAEFLAIDFEQVAALEPDLIVGASGMRQEDYELASRIAPTIPQPPGEAEYSSAPWQDTQRYVGEALGRSALADAVVAEVEATIDAARQAHPEFQGKTAVVAQVDEGQYAVRGSTEIWSEFLSDMGFTIPPEIVGPDFTEISAENVEMFGALDVLVWLATPDQVGVSAIYPGLTVAHEGRDVYVDAFGSLSGAIGFNSALSLPLVVDQLVPMLAAAVDGDPATATGAATATPSPTSAPSTTAAPTRELGRVVVLAEEFMLADVMSLGIEPIASTASVAEVGFQGLDGFDTAAIEALPMTTLNLEQLAAMEPDTIISLQFWIDQIGEEQLGGLGDIVAVPDGLPIPERLTFLGEQLGRQSQAAGVIADLEAATAAAAAAIPDDCAVSLAAIYPGPSPAAFVAGPWELPTSILSTGCRLDPGPSDAAPDANGRVYLSLEQLGILDAPTLVLLQSETVQGEQEALDQIEANPLWATLPAVRDDHVIVFDRLGYPGAAGQIRFLGELADRLAS